MRSRPAAELLGPESTLRQRLAERLEAAGWSATVASTFEASASDGPLDLGVLIPVPIPSVPLTTPSSVWWASVTDNLTPAFRCAKRLVPRLSRSSGAFVFVSSIYGEIGGPSQTAWSATSAGLIGLAKALTVDLPEVRFSAVAAAWPAPEERWRSADVDWRAALDPTDVDEAIADAVLFLADDTYGHHRGQVIRIPSGITT